MENTGKKIWGLSIFNATVKGITTGVFFFWAIYFASIGFSGFQIGTIFAVQEIVSLISILPSGFINDRIKSKNLVTIGLIMLAIQFIGISFFQTFPMIMTFAIIGGIGQKLYAASSDSLFYKSIDKKKATKRIAVYQSLNYLFIGLGIILSGQILHLNIPFEDLIKWAGGAYLIMAAISQILPSTIIAHFEFLKYKKDIFKPKVLFFLGIVFLFSIHFGAEGTSYGLFLEKNLGLENQWIGIYMGTSIFLMGFWAVFFSKILKKIRVKSLLFTGLLLSSIGHIMMAYPEPVYSWIFRVFHEAGDAAMFVFFAYGITSLFDKDRIGGNASMVTFMTILGGTTGAAIFGPIGEHFGYDIPFIATGGVVFVAFILALLMNRYIIHHPKD